MSRMMPNFSGDTTTVSGSQPGRSVGAVMGGSGLAVSSPPPRKRTTAMIRTTPIAATTIFWVRACP